MIRIPGYMMLLVFLFLVRQTEAQDRPNILWINGDDLGQEVACYGNPDVSTPHMDQMASEGLLFLNAYANAPVCSASRSSQITGMYPSAINCLNHRAVEMQELPNGVVPVMELFRKAGYFCSNGWANDMGKKGKEDYNFVGTDWFDGTDWKQRADGQPFFAQVQVHEPHRDFVKDPDNPVDPTGVQLPGCYPDHPLIRADWGMYLESVQTADKHIGAILDRLESEGLADNTIVFIFGDHGRPHLRDKQWLYEGGLKVPLIIRWPGRFSGGEVKEDLVSLVDVTAMSLAAAGLAIPDYMHGKDVLGGDKREYVYGFRQRCGDAVDDIRSVSDGLYKLIWNRMPEKPYMQLSSYKKLQYPAFTLYRVLDKQGKLEEPFTQFMEETRPEIEFYDLNNDPDELNNLAGNKEYRKAQKRLYTQLKTTLDEVEKDMQAESPESIEKAQKGSAAYMAQGFERKGLADYPSDEEILEFWEKELLSDNSPFGFGELLPGTWEKANIISEEEYNVWGTNILKGKDGLYHAIYSRWPKSRGHMAWVTHSEIAHAVSRYLTGPYVFQNVVLPARGKEYWDGDCTHNPHVLEYEGKYYLYHMGNRGSGYWDNTPDTLMPPFHHDEWWVNRNNQRIGLAVAENLNGPWKRFDKPLIDVDSIRRMVSTPVVSIRPDGKFLMAYKYVEENEDLKGGRVIHVTALSDSPKGPFKDTGIPFITHPTASFAIDDHIEWLQDGSYYCIGKDSRGAWSDYPDGSTMLFESDESGLYWKPAENFLVIKAGEIKWSDGTSTLCQRTADMPKFFMEDGVPKALIVAVLPEDSEISFSVVIPLKSQVFPYQVTEESANRPLSAAMDRSFNHYPSPLSPENELYSQFRYTKLKGFDYKGGDGTITRRDPSKVILENGKYYVWYTRRFTSTPPMGAKKSNDTIPSTDWDLAEIWYATSDDGFTWEEQGVAVTRPPKPIPGWRAVATPDILKWKGSYYLYFQAFLEASGTRGDYCPVSVAWSDSPDGPWTHVNKVVVPTGGEGEWDQYAIQAPTPLVHDGKIYVYYKAAFNRPGTVWSGIGLAIADDPLGPFEKHALNPVQNSGHEICFFPFKEGLASLVIRDGNEHYTIQYAEDWVNFEIAAITEMMPIGPNAYIPDAFADNGDGRGISWGICHFRNARGPDGQWYSILARFDCDLSLDLHDPEMKGHNNLWNPEDYFRWGLSKKQLERREKVNSHHWPE